MAAYAALVSLMNDLDLIPNHQIHSFSFDNKQITSLSQTVHFLIDFMDNYDSDQVLESRIASAAHAAHDVIESHIVDQIHAGTTRDGKSRSFFLLDLQKAIDNMDYVKRKAICFKAKSGLQATYSAAPAASSEPLSSEKKNAMVGFEAVVLRLLEKLTGEPSAQQVIPIVGMGGLGKTTLARHVFDHSFIKQHFDLCLWATISQNYSAENILNELLSQNSSRNVSELGVQLHQKLWGRRYLIVLDDMWSVEAWDEIQRFLLNNENGSCVIVTTRLSNLAADHLSSSPFVMDFLDDDQSWELFCGKTFGEERCPIELEEIGKKIVKRCRGLPLSIVVIGGHLKRSSRAIEYWEKVANFINPISSLGANEQCLKIISLSYEHLPGCLKTCFLYLGIFEEDAWIDASKLFQFWFAEGFVKGKKDLSLEEVAEDYLKDFSERNLILVRRRRWNGKVEEFVIHDTVRELCLKVGEQEKFFGVLDTAKVIRGGMERQIVVPRELSWLQPHAVGALQLPSLFRSLLFQQGVWHLDELWFDLRLLRLWADVNPARLCGTLNFDNVNLRYLAFSGGYIYPIDPSLMSLFWNIQTLICGPLRIPVPYDIWEMTQLRHLEFAGDEGLFVEPLPSVMNDQSDQEKCIVLDKLHTLLGVLDLRLTEEVCKRMPNIKNLSISYSGQTGDCEASSSSYYCLHNLGRLNKLESLRCGFGDDYMWRDVVLSLVLLTSLEELTLWSCHWEDLEKIMKSLPRLGSLELRYIQGAEWDLAKEELEFPRLKELTIEGCDDLINWNANSSHFPVLETLHILEAPKLSEIPFDIGEIPTLGRIYLDCCSVSAAVSAMRIVVEQESCGNNNLLLEVNFGHNNQLLEGESDHTEEVKRFQTMVQEECLTTNSLHLSYRYSKIKA